MCDNAETLWGSNGLHPQWTTVDFHLIEQTMDSSAIKGLNFNPDVVQLVQNHILLFEVKVNIKFRKVAAPAFQIIAVHTVLCRAS